MIRLYVKQELKKFASYQGGKRPRGGYRWPFQDEDLGMALVMPNEFMILGGPGETEGLPVVFLMNDLDESLILERHGQGFGLEPWHPRRSNH